MIEKPVYGINTSGITMPFLVWKFSIIVAKILGKAKALPLRVCARLILPSESLYLNLSLLDW